MKKSVIIVILALMILGIVISGCVKRDIENIPESELQEICEEEFWPPEGCSVIDDPIGRRLCEKCEVLEEAEEGLVKEEDITQLTSFENAIDPDWSPDGSQIVFCRMQGQTQTLYLINADGTGLTEIGSGFDPSWSPVEDKIAYELNNQIYIMKSDGKDNTQLTTEPSNSQSAWNPDGTKIAYTHYESGKPSIWIMNSDGTGKVQLTTEEDGPCSWQSFSYDGSKIVYVKGQVWYPSSEQLPKAPNEIWIMNSDGSNKHQIYAPEDTYQWIFQRAWNKNDEIIFGTSPLQEIKIPEIGIINSDGNNLRFILNPPMDSLGMPECVYGDSVWDNSGTKIALTKKMIDGPINIGIFSWEE